MLNKSVTHFFKIRNKILTRKDRLEFGKYTGYSIEEILTIDPSYLLWCIKNVNLFALQEDIVKEAESRLDLLSKAIAVRRAKKFFEMDYTDDYNSEVRDIIDED